MPKKKVIPVNKLTPEEIQEFSYGIVNVKSISFNMDESAFIADKNKQAIVEMAHMLGVKLNVGIIELRLKIQFHYPENNQLQLAEITVQNSFNILDLKKYIRGNFLVLPTEFLISAVSISISHGRALFSHNLAGSIYQNFVLPISNPFDVTKHFFKGSYNIETGEFYDSTQLENLRLKM